MVKSELVLQLAVFGTAALIIGLLVIKVYPTSKRLNPTPVITAQSINSIKDKIPVFPPTSIAIPSINLDLPVATGVISDNQWTLYDDKVSWLSTSKTLGKGNVILYAHNRVGLFASLKRINIGDEINVRSGNKIFTYKVKLKQSVTPDNVNSILSKDNQLTLYTCDGSFDQKRLIIIATLENTS